MNFNISGLSSSLLLRLADSTLDNRRERFQNEVQYERATDAFYSQIEGINTPAELVQNYDVYSYVMRAFDLEDQIFGKAMIRKVLESDPSDSSSLVNLLTDSRFKDLHEAMGFSDSVGVQPATFKTVRFQDGIVEKYTSRALLNRQIEQNATVGAALEFREDYSNITSWFTVLGDESLTEFFQVALGLPSSISGLDVDKQKEIFESKFDLDDLQDTSEREDLISRFLLLSDIQDTSTLIRNNTVLQLISPLGTIDDTRNFTPETLDIPSVRFSASSLY
jgi:hypothetical protein